MDHELGGPPDNDKSAWLDVKFTLGLDFPNLPYVIDGDYKITESIAIHRYLADKYCPSLLGNNTEHRAEVTMLEGILCGPVSGLNSQVRMPCYSNEKEKSLKAI